MENQVTSLLGSKYRSLKGRWRIITISLSTIAISISLFYLFSLRPFGFVIMDRSYLYLLLAAFLPICFIWVPATRKATRDNVPFYDLLLSAVAIAVPLFFIYHIEDVYRTWEVGAPPLPTALSFILWLVVLEAGRRGGGIVFFIVVVFFSFYPLVGSHMPGILWSPNTSLPRLATFHALGQSSMMGVPLYTFGRIIVGFMVFSVVVQAVGAGKFFNDLALAVVGQARAGIAKVATVSSGLFGSISGVSMANVYMTGSFTIPAMKKEGIPAHVAAAVEAVASTGGILMPPVMGSTAFIMAEFMGLPYAQVAIAAAIPSILYYIALFAHVDAFAARHGVKPMPITVEVPPIWRTLVNNSHILVSFIVLIVLIFFLRLTAQAPWIASVFAIVLGLIRKETRITPKRIVSLIEDTGLALGELVGILAAIGLLIGAFVVTGIAYGFPYALVDMAGGNLYFLLFLGALAAFILGMGVPLTAVYIFLAIVLAPALIAVGIDRMAAHLYVLYWAMMACITPPVAITAFAAASIAGADPMKTGFYSMRLAVSKYILPFAFVLSPALILQESFMNALAVIPSAIVGFIVISGAFEGYFWRIGRLTMVSRVILGGAGLLLALPGTSTDIYGGIVLLVFYAVYILLKKRSSLVKALVLMD